MAAPPRGRRREAGEGAARPPRPRGKVRDHCSSSEPRRRRRRKLFSNFLFSPFRQSSAIRGAKLVLQCSQWPNFASISFRCNAVRGTASLAQALSQEVFARRPSVSVFSLEQPSQSLHKILLSMYSRMRNSCR